MAAASPLREVIETIRCDDVIRVERLSCGHFKTTLTASVRPAKRRRCHACSTRLGKVVGSYRRPLEAWTYWAEGNWTTGDPGFVVVAPSGARFEWFPTEAEAAAAAARRNREES